MLRFHSEHPFRNRNEAGQLLARHLKEEVAQADWLVVALPRGGVVIGYEIAKLIGVLLELLIVRKMGAPSQPELAIGAVASGGYAYLNQELIDLLGIDLETVSRIRENSLRELERREKSYLPHSPKISLRGKKILLVDDGIATGATIEVALRAIKAAQPASIAIAVPVAPLATIEKLHRFVDRIYVLQNPSELSAVGDFYEEFNEVTDGQVTQMLDEVNSIDTNFSHEA